MACPPGRLTQPVARASPLWALLSRLQPFPNAKSPLSEGSSFLWEAAMLSMKRTRREGPKSVTHANIGGDLLPSISCLQVHHKDNGIRVDAILTQVRQDIKPSSLDGHLSLYLRGQKVSDNLSNRPTEFGMFSHIAMDAVDVSALNHGTGVKETAAALLGQHRITLRERSRLG